jgi:excisionase family DNA binding protein
MDETRERLYTMREACSQLGVHPNTLRRWDKERKIRTVRPERGQRRIPESEITRLLAKKPISPPSEQISLTPQQEIPMQELLSHFLDYVFSYHRDDWELVKRAILIRDGYTCSKCGAKELLEVHHKDGTSRNDPDNLNTLCQKCHQEIHKAISEHKARKIPQKEKIQPLERVKTEIKPDKVSPEKEVPRRVVLDELTPVGLLQRTTFGDLLSAATVLNSFALEELAARARCPATIAKVFCERMSDRGYLASVGEGYEMRVKVGT